MRQATTELLDAINTALDGKPLRRTLAGMGVPQARVAAAASAVSRARNGAPLSFKAENELRGYLAQPLLPPGKGKVDLCPDCGGPHAAPRCWGKEVVDVVVLTHGQQVVGDAPPGHLLAVHQGTVKAVLCRSEIRQCGCGVCFVPRSWNHRKCQPECTWKPNPKHDTPL